MTKKNISFGSLMNENETPINYNLKSSLKHPKHHFDPNSSELKRLEEENRQLRLSKP